MKLTQANASKVKLPAGKTDHVEWCDALPGFGLRIREGGSRVWVAQYKIADKNRRVTLGKYSELTADQARNGWEAHGQKHPGAALMLANAGQGIDAANMRAERRSSAGNTFDAASADWLAAEKPGMKPRYYEDCERYMNDHWKPLHGLTLESITRPVVAARLRVLTKERGATASNRARNTLSTFFAWAIAEGVCAANPVMGTNKNEERTRERVLTDAELVAIWKHATEGDFGKIVRLLMLTVQRRDEIGHLSRSELVRKGDGAPCIALPGERTKNGRPHEVPLTDAAMAIINTIPETKGRDLLFGSGEGGFSGWSKSKKALDAACKVKGWTLHDLRRTGATRMADSGVQPHIIEAVLNHVSGHKAGVAGVYNRATYATEKRQALEVLATYIKTAIAKSEGANVSKLKRA